MVGQADTPAVGRTRHGAPIEATIVLRRKSVGAFLQSMGVALAAALLLAALVPDRLAAAVLIAVSVTIIRPLAARQIIVAKTSAGPCVRMRSAWAGTRARGPVEPIGWYEVGEAPLGWNVDLDGTRYYADSGLTAGLIDVFGTRPV